MIYFIAIYFFVVMAIRIPQKLNNRQARLVTFVPVINVGYLLFLVAAFLGELIEKRGGNMGNGNLERALSKKKEVEEIEEKLAKEKDSMRQLKGKAKEDIEWVLSDKEE